MKIARVETFLVPPRWLFLRIETTSGLVGWGEPVLEGRAETVRAAIDEMTPQLIGRDAGRIEDLWQVLTRGSFYRGGPVLSSAVAGIDQALWDLAGRRFGVPVHELLGGPVRDRVRVYGWITGDCSGTIDDAVASRIELGFDCVKMNAGLQLAAIDTQAQVDSIVRRAEELRTALGPSRDFALDFHGRSSPAMSRRVLPLLEASAPLFVEEPTVPELATAWLPAISASTTVPIATGERVYSRWDFAPLLDTGIAVVQPDVSHCGGISELRRIAVLAETAGIVVAPHCPLGPIALASSLQLDFAMPNFLIQELTGASQLEGGWGVLDYLIDTSVLDIRGGHIERLTQPGLGIEIDEVAVRRAAEEGHQWRPPVWRHPDGSFAEW